MHIKLVSYISVSFALIFLGEMPSEDHRHFPFSLCPCASEAFQRSRLCLVRLLTVLEFLWRYDVLCITDIFKYI
jgi:hypothetical protein